MPPKVLLPTTTADRLEWWKSRLTEFPILAVSSYISSYLLLPLGLFPVPGRENHGNPRQIQEIEISQNHGNISKPLSSPHKFAPPGKLASAPMLPATLLRAPGHPAFAHQPGRTPKAVPPQGKARPSIQIPNTQGSGAGGFILAFVIGPVSPEAHEAAERSPPKEIVLNQ